MHPIVTSSYYVMTPGAAEEVNDSSCRVHGAIVTAAAAVDAQLAIKDDTTQIVPTLKVPAGSNTQVFSFPAALKVNTSLNVTLTGVGTTATVFWGP